MDLGVSNTTLRDGMQLHNMFYDYSYTKHEIRAQEVGRLLYPTPSPSFRTRIWICFSEVQNKAYGRRLHRVKRIHVAFYSCANILNEHVP